MGYEKKDDVYRSTVRKNDKNFLNIIELKNSQIIQEKNKEGKPDRLTDFHHNHITIWLRKEKIIMNIKDSIGTEMKKTKRKKTL